MENVLLSIVNIMIMGLSISYYFTTIHQLKYTKKKTFIMFYISFLTFSLLSLLFRFNSLIMMICMFVTLFIISCIFIRESMEKRIMIIGIFGLIFFVEEMFTFVFSFLMFKSYFPIIERTFYYSVFKMCISNLQLFGYCFFVKDFIFKQFSFFKSFYLIPIGQAIMLLIIYYLAVLKCQIITGYLFILLALLIFWYDFVLYKAFLSERKEKMLDIKYVQSQVFNSKYNELRKLKHDLMNHYSVLKIMILNNDHSGVNEYMKKMKDLYREDTYDI